MRKLWIGSAILAGMLATGCAMTPAEPAMPMAHADAKMPAMPAMKHYHAMLAAEGPSATAGTGMGMFMFEPSTHTLTYDVTFSNLTGPAVAAHIHGPVAEGGKGPPVVPFPSAASPIKGTATLTDAQAADLAAGKYYVNIHTAANPGGEIRGTIKPE
ncbi:MAG: CHRD domain-containing protein [Hyphomonadaceae bacterium]